ncbi:MAG: DUF1801 domain-containing protein [Candidatus Saccharimonas sp.]
MTDVQQYLTSLEGHDQEICRLLQSLISNDLPDAENKVWHAHPVWFLDGNPIVGYSKRKAGIQLMFWSGADFDEPALRSGTGKFKDASITYQTVDDINEVDLSRWLQKSRGIQWDYKNIVKRRGVLERLK